MVWYYEMPLSDYIIRYLTGTLAYTRTTPTQPPHVVVVVAPKPACIVGGLDAKDVAIGTIVHHLGGVGS